MSGEGRMLVRDCMTQNPITLRPSSDPLAGLAICKSGGFCHLPVVDDEGRLVGMITEEEIRHFLATAPPPSVMQRQHRVEQAMRARRHRPTGLSPGGGGPVDVSGTTSVASLWWRPTGVW